MHKTSLDSVIKCYHTCLRQHHISVHDISTRACATRTPAYAISTLNKISDPEIKFKFEKGNFCENNNETLFCIIGVDHAIELVDIIRKAKGVYDSTGGYVESHKVLLLRLGYS